MTTKHVIREIIVELYRKNMIKFGEYMLSSGRKSPYYIDLRILPSYPSLYRRIMEKLISNIEQEGVEYDVVAGIETSGIIHAAYLGCLTNKPIAYIRKKAKEHGTKKLIEGIVENKRVLIVDDVSTTGNTLYNAVLTLRENKAIVEKAYVIIDRCEGAREKLASINVELKPLINIYDIIRVLEEEKLVNREKIEALKTYLGNIAG